MKLQKDYFDRVREQNERANWLYIFWSLVISPVLVVLIYLIVK